MNINKKYNSIDIIKFINKFNNITNFTLTLLGKALLMAYDQKYTD